MSGQLNAVAVAGVNRDLVAIRAAMNILDKWGCTPEQQQHILQVSKPALYKYRNQGTKTASLTRDQLTRISYLFNIHAALRIVFTNPDNVYGFMKMENFNGYFDGATPLSLIEGGDFGRLYEVFKRIDSLRSGMMG